MTEDFTAALNEKLPLKEILKNDEWERLFRSGLRSKDEQLINYLSSDEVLADMIESLVNEEDRSLQDASEVLGVLLTNLDAVNEALAANHLGALFKYLDRKTMNPRRMYFFLRLSSFLFQNRTKESFQYAIKTEGFTQRLVRHLGSPHILQLVLLILTLERQIKPEDPTLDWSGRTNLIGCLVSMLENDAHATLESVFKFLQEIVTHNPPTSDFVKNTISANNGALITCLVKLCKEKSMAQDALRVLDEFVLKFTMLNQEDEVFFKKVSEQLAHERSTVFEEMLKSDSQMHVLSGVKFLNALTKHKAFFLLGNGLRICVDLLFRFPWSNILHNTIVVVVGSALQDENHDFLDDLLDYGLLKLIVKGLANPNPTGCKPHLRQLAATMQMTRSPKALERLAVDPLWEKYWSVMELRKNPDVTFVDAEKQIVIKLQECLKEGGLESGETKKEEKVEETKKVEEPKKVEESKVEETKKESESKVEEGEKGKEAQVPKKEEPKTEVKEEAKTEVKEEPKKEEKAQVKEETKTEVKEEPKKEEKTEVKEEPKKEEKTEVKEQPKKEEKTEVKEEPKKEEKTEVKDVPKTEVKEETKKEEKTEAKEEAKKVEEPKVVEEPKKAEKPVEEPPKTAESKPENVADAGAPGGTTPVEEKN